MSDPRGLLWALQAQFDAALERADRPALEALRIEIRELAPNDRRAGANVQRLMAARHSPSPGDPEISAR